MVGGGLPGRISVPRLMETLFGPTVDDAQHPSKDLAMDTLKGSDILTLEPYVPKPPPRRRRTIKAVTMEELFSSPAWSQYITLTLNENATPFSDLVLYRSLKKILGRDNPRFSIEKNRIIVKATNEEESRRLLATTAIGTNQVIATDEPHYNTRTGTMLLERLRVENDTNESICEIIKEILEDQN